MKHIIRILIIFLLALPFFYSCQKSLHDASLHVTDSASAGTVAFLPKQLISTDTTEPVATRTKQYYSLKYAPGNQQIDIYLDDTTNTNPYDVLNTSYIFNSAGYLTRWAEKDGSGQDLFSVDIKRNGDNKIIYLNNLYKNAGAIIQNDTSFFGYQQAGSGTLITTIEKNIDYVNNQPQSPYYDTVSYTYDITNKLQQVKVNGAFSINNGTYTYLYNANTSIQSIHLDGFGMRTMDAAFLYTSGLADAKEDALAKLFLGKDYYLQGIKYFPATGDQLDEPNYFVISLTNPFHLSTVRVTANTSGSISSHDYNYSYQVNKDLLPFTTGTSYGILTEFRY